MRRIPHITETEWEIMRVIWAGHPVTAAEIIRRLCAADRAWHPKTVRTLLARLARRKALAFEPQGRAYVYEPLVTERECVAAASETFLNRVFGGAFMPLVAHFVEARKLDKKDLEELRSLLEEEARKQSDKQEGKSCK